MNPNVLFGENVSRCPTESNSHPRPTKLSSGSAHNSQCHPPHPSPQHTPPSPPHTSPRHINPRRSALPVHPRHPPQIPLSRLAPKFITQPSHVFLREQRRPLLCPPSSSSSHDQHKNSRAK